MTDINTLVSNNFNDNISYLQTCQPELFSKLSALDSAIELGHYKEKYELTYENNYFDVLEKETNNYLYGKDSTVHASLAQESIDYHLHDNLFEGFHKHDISEDDLKVYEEKRPFEHHMSGFAPIIHYTNLNLPKNASVKAINKFVFFGVGLGLHITSIHKKIHSSVYFIIEDDLELFRLSLFSTNYKNIAADSTLIFSVFEDNNQFSASAVNFLRTEYYYNHHLKYFHLLSHSEDKISQFHIATTSQSHLLFYYNHLLTQYLTPLNYIFDDYKFLNKTLSLSDKVLDKKPFLLIAAGPSLQKNIQWLRKNHNNFIIVALSATLSILEKENIFPNIITHLDPFDTARIHFDKLNSLDFIKDSICMFSSRIPPDVVSMFDKKQLFFFETGTQYKKLSIKPSAPCVGSLTYQLLLRLHVKNLYLLGLDLAIDSKTGKTHSDAHEYIQTMKTEEDAFDGSSINFRESLFNIDGNFSKQVLTTPSFHVSIDAINQASKILKKEDQKVFNLSDGAKLIDTTPIRSDEVAEGSDQDIKAHLYNLCLKNSSTHLGKDDRKSLFVKLEHAKQMNELVINYQNLKKQDTDEYIEHLEKLCLSINNQDNIKNFELARVLDTYFQYILSYIFNFFNTDELPHEEEHMQNLDNLLVPHLLKIIDFYHKSLESKLTHKDNR